MPFYHPHRASLADCAAGQAQRSTLRHVAVACALILLAGCSSSKVITLPPAALTQYEPTVALKQLWQNREGHDALTEITPFEIFLAADRLYLAGRDGGVTVLDANSGKRLMHSELKDEFQTGVGGGEGLLLLANRQGKVIALDADTLGLRWEANLSSEVLSLPQIDQGVVVVRTNDGKISALDSASGNRRWQHSSPTPALTVRGTSAPLVTGGAVFAGMDNGRMIAIALQSGQPAWEATVGLGRGRSEIERLVDIDGDPVLATNRLFATAYQDRMVALEPNNGQLIWERPFSSRHTLGVDYRALFGITLEDELWAIAQSNGGTLWRQDALQRRRLSPPLVMGPWIFVGDYEGYLHCLDAASGNLLGRIRVASRPIAARPVGMGDTVITQAIDGTVTSVAVDFLD